MLAAIPVVAFDAPALAPVGVVGSVHHAVIAHGRAVIVVMVIVPGLGEGRARAGQNDQGGGGCKYAFHGCLLIACRDQE
jgi:hypothetical protein